MTWMLGNELARGKRVSLIGRMSSKDTYKHKGQVDYNLSPCSVKQKNHATMMSSFINSMSEVRQPILGK